MNSKDRIRAKMAQNVEIVDTLSEGEQNFVERHMDKIEEINGTYVISLTRANNNQTLSINICYGSTFIK